jgi:predicted site-specific integrase-resolvase
MSAPQQLGAAKAPPSLRVGIYKRVSTTDQAEDGYSLDMQERVLRAYCADHGYEVYDVYADEGISGKDIKHRQGMRRLLADADARRYDIILVWAYPLGVTAGAIMGSAAAHYPPKASIKF